VIRLERYRAPVLRKLAVVALALATPASASAATIQLSNPAGATPPSCPSNPCAAISRTTAFQATDGAATSPFAVTQPGRLTSWSVSLGAPDKRQIHYFDKHEHGTARAAIGVLRSVGGADYELVESAPLVHLQPWFGRTATIKLRHPLRVEAGELIALIVPTWAPALALNYPSSVAWQASRSSTECNNVALQTVQDVIGSRATYGCSYPTAQVAYAATERTR
jgi:hypothetical protein